MNRKTITLVVAGHFLAVLMVGYISGCASNQPQAGRTRVLIKDEFARNSMPSSPQYVYTAPSSTVTYAPVQDMYPATSPNVAMSIPHSPSDQLYTVKKGDTLFSISRQYNVSHKELAQLNSITDPGLIKVGEQLRIPGGATQSVPQSSSTMMAKKAEPKVEKEEVKQVASKPVTQDYKPVPASTVRKTSTYAIHTVKRGENIWRIAEKYDVKVDAICELNNMNRNTELAAGDRIKIPVN
ncbi:MAG: LysM peptidoglycan-binding domain-containing protein [Candidatus Auribacterota bacterium]